MCNSRASFANIVTTYIVYFRARFSVHYFVNFEESTIKPVNLENDFKRIWFK